MAAESAGGTFRPGDKSFLCHSKTRSGIVVCVICENIYHASCFERIENVTVLSDVFVICPNHDGLKLTSNYDRNLLSSEVKSIIAQIKKTSISEIKEKILLELDASEDEDVIKSELESLRIENAILKDLNNELKEKNQLLRDKIDMEKIIIPTLKTKSFAEITASNERRAPKRVPRIIVKRERKDVDIQKISDKVNHYLIKDKSIQTKRVIKKSEEEIIINCKDEESADKTIKALAKLTNVCSIKKEEMLNPKVKVVGINNCENLDNEALENDINSRNFNDLKKKSKVLFSYKNPRTNLQTIILEATNEIYSCIRENKNRIFIGHQSCRVFDHINVKPCFKCSRYGHKGAKCRNEVVCLKCTGKHKTSECNQDDYKCPNCSHSNNKYKTKFNTRHLAFDSHECEVLKSKIRKMIETTDYSIFPDIPRYLGKVEQQHFQARSPLASALSTTSLNSINSGIITRRQNK